MATTVTPCVGVWIEIPIDKLKRLSALVTPCVGVWIEIRTSVRLNQCFNVTPCVGVWIEMSPFGSSQVMSRCHSLRGSVD